MRGKTRLFSAAAVIARRDYVATVWSRSFLLFLLTPLILVGFVAGFGAIGGQQDGVALRPIVAVITDPKDAASLRSAYDALTERGSRLPEFRIAKPEANHDKQALSLLTASSKTASVVLIGWPDKPRIVGPSRKIEELTPDVRAVLEEVALANSIRKARIKRPDVPIDSMVVDPAGGNTSSGRYVIARGAQTTLFMLTILLAGMLLSNLVEEKSNKVIEVLAAAVPIDAIFLGKLTAMLGVSLTGITIWGTLIGGAVVATMAPGAPIPVPAIGWPLFVLLGMLYYIMNYMILGGLFLGIGSQASSVREVQTLSMPVTMAQLAIFALGSSVVNDLDGPLGLFAAIFPLSSPLTMLARAAQDEVLWPHLLALGWQALWVALIIRFAARRFRTGVLKSGSPKRGGWFGKKATD
ncbi:MAG: ABC transporter permease [Sphingomonadales bacterium]